MTAPFASGAGSDSHDLSTSPLYPNIPLRILTRRPSKPPFLGRASMTTQSYFSQADLNELYEHLDAVARLAHVTGDEVISSAFRDVCALVTRLQAILLTSPTDQEREQHQAELNSSRTGKQLRQAGRSSDIGRSEAIRGIAELLGASLLQTRIHIASILNDPNYLPPTEIPAESIVDSAIDSLPRGISTVLTWMGGPDEVRLIYTGEARSRGRNGKREGDPTFTDKEKVLDWLMRSSYILTTGERLLKDPTQEAKGG